MGGPNKHCQVCREAESKYKCPSCLIPYCSLFCYKKHKESPCSIPVSSDSKPVPALLPKNSYQVDESSLILSKAKLEGLVVSDEVCNALKEEKLQKLIYMIDATTNSENFASIFETTSPRSVSVLKPELDKAMELEDFRKFTEKILSVVGRP